MIKLRIISIKEWQHKIAPHWGVSNPDHISNFNNPFGMIRYVGSEIFTRILLFPVCLEWNGTPVAYSSIYNISDTHIRIRGIYVEPPFRGQGFGHMIITKMLELWPQPWSTVIGYFRPETWANFKKYSHLTECPHVQQRISLFSQSPLILAWKRFSANPQLPSGNDFIKQNIHTYGLLGSNNQLNPSPPISAANHLSYWGYDNSCAPNPQRFNGRSIFFVDFLKYLNMPPPPLSRRAPLRFQNMSYDPYQKKVIGTDDWGVEFHEDLLQKKPSYWGGDFAAAVRNIKQHTTRFDQGFLLDHNLSARPESPHCPPLSSSANYKHFIPLSRFTTDINTAITEVYGTAQLL